MARHAADRSQPSIFDNFPIIKAHFHFPKRSWGCSCACNAVIGANAAVNGSVFATKMRSLKKRKTAPAREELQNTQEKQSLSSTAHNHNHSVTNTHTDTHSFMWFRLLKLTQTCIYTHSFVYQSKPIHSRHFGFFSWCSFAPFSIMTPPLLVSHSPSLPTMFLPLELKHMHADMPVSTITTPRFPDIFQSQTRICGKNSHLLSLNHKPGLQQRKASERDAGDSSCLWI